MAAKSPGQPDDQERRRTHAARPAVLRQDQDDEEAATAGKGRGSEGEQHRPQRPSHEDRQPLEDEEERRRRSNGSSPGSENPTEPPE